MTHFRECIETICKTTGLSKTEIANQLNIRVSTLSNWLVSSPPRSKIPMIMHTLRQLIHRKEQRPSVEEYKRLKAEGMKDKEIANLWNYHPSSIHMWKVNNGIPRNTYKKRVV